MGAQRESALHNCSIVLGLDVKTRRLPRDFFADSRLCRTFPNIRGLSKNDKHRTESAELSDDFAACLWEHTPPLEGRGRAVRRKVNGRVTGWNPLSLREGEGAGGEEG